MSPPAVLGDALHRLCAVACLLAAGLWLAAWSGGVEAAPAYRFRTPSVQVPVALGAQVLTPEERAFIAGLPEIRVAVPLPPARPYESISADGEISGIHPDMLVSLARAFGLKLRPVVMPDWSSALTAARQHEVDLLMTLGVTTDRAEYLAFTLGATPLPGALFARTPGPGASAPAPPSRGRFALERAYMANDYVRREYPDATIVTVETTGEALAAVAAGRADYYVGSMLEAVDWLAREPRAGVEMSRLVTYGTGFYHFAVRKDWAPLALILNKGIATLRAQALPALTSAMAAVPGAAGVGATLAFTPAEADLLAARPTWRIGAVRGLAMLNDVDTNGQHSGIAAEYAEQVARRLAVGLQLVPFDNVGAMLDALRIGAIDVVPFLTRTPERERQFGFSTPYVSMPYMIIARSDAPMYWDLNSLRGKRLALAAQHPLLDVLVRGYPDIQVVATSNGNEALNAVAAGQADAAVEVKLFANLRINGDNDGRLRAVAEVEDLPAQFRFATSPQARPLLPLIDRALADIPAAERERLMRRWVARDLSPAFPWRRYMPLIATVAGALLALAGWTGWWMRRLQREVQRRRQSEEQLNDVGEALPGVAFRYVIDGSGAMVSTYFSPGARDFLGIELDPARTVLSNIAPRLRPEHREMAERAQKESLRGGGRFKATAAYAHPGGREMWLHAEAVPKALPGGLTAWTGFLVDVTSERELQARAAHEAEARNLLLASASHELRAPTHTLSLALQSLGDAGVPDSQAGRLRIAQDAAQTLTQLLNDVLDAARLDQGELQLHPQVFALHELLRQIAEGTRDGAERKGLQFAVEIGPEVPATVRLDPLRLRQILTNLLSNAVKYTERGGVSLQVAAQRDGEHGTTLAFTVSDTGRGIAADQLGRLFQPFATAGGDRTPVPEGSSGLGLAISRRLAGLMGGAVTLASAPGQGTRAMLTLPVAWPVAPGGARVPADGAVLVCDDDDTSRTLMAYMLASRGYRVTECNGGESALNALREGGIQALVTDFDMAGMDGLALIAGLRAEEQARGLAPLRVIVCSGSPVPAQPDGTEMPAFDAWLSKPVDMPVLVGTLETLGVRPARHATQAAS